MNFLGLTHPLCSSLAGQGGWGCPQRCSQSVTVSLDMEQWLHPSCLGFQSYGICSQALCPLAPANFEGHSIMLAVFVVGIDDIKGLFQPE